MTSVKRKEIFPREAFSLEYTFRDNHFQSSDFIAGNWAWKSEDFKIVRENCSKCFRRIARVL